MQGLLFEARAAPNSCEQRSRSGLVSDPSQSDRDRRPRKKISIRIPNMIFSKVSHIRTYMLFTCHDCKQIQKLSD